MQLGDKSHIMEFGRLCSSCRPSISSGRDGCTKRGHQHAARLAAFVKFFTSVVDGVLRP